MRYKHRFFDCDSVHSLTCGMFSENLLGDATVDLADDSGVKVDTYSRLDPSDSPSSPATALGSGAPDGDNGWMGTVLRPMGTMWQDRRFITLAAAFVWLVFCIWVNIVLNIHASIAINSFVEIPFAHNLTFANRSLLVQLPDTGFKIVPDIVNTLPGLPDVWIVLLSVPLLQLCWDFDTLPTHSHESYCAEEGDECDGRNVLASRLCSRGNSARVVSLSVLLLSTCLLEFLFSSCVWAVATPLPNPIRHCELRGMTDNYDTSREAFHIMTDSGASCTDLYYANRVASLTLLGLLWHRYSHVVPVSEIDQVGIICYHDYDPNRSTPAGEPLRCTTAKLLMWAAVSLGYLFVLMAHQHYSIDIIFGIVTPIWLWNNYHILLVSVGPERPTACCGWFRRMIVWLEAGAEDYPANGAAHAQQYNHDASADDDDSPRRPPVISRQEKHQVIVIVRGDLDLTPARLASQCSHVMLGLVRRLNNSQAAEHALQQWELWGMPKATLTASSEDAMLSAEALAKSHNLFSHSVSDSELSAVDAGKTGKTVIVIGPAPTARLSKITKNCDGLSVMT